MNKTIGAPVAIVLVGVATFSAWMFFSRERNEPAVRPLFETVDQSVSTAESPVTTPAPAVESLPTSDDDSQVAPEDEVVVAYRDRLNSHQIILRGSEDPESIPYGVKMRAVFRDLAARQQSLGDSGFAQTLKSQYQARDSDVARLREYASGDRAFRDEVEREMADSLTGLCREILEVGAKVMGPQQIAARLTAMKERRLVRMEAHYKEALAGLNPITRQYLATEARTQARGITHGTTDYIGMANDLPEFFAREWESNCSRSIQRSAAADSGPPEPLSTIAQ